MVVGIMLCKNEADRYLPKVLNQLTSICDKVIVLDDGSTDYTMDLCLEYGCLVFHKSDSTWETNELELRKLLWELGTECLCDGDWVICLDADETFHDIDKLADRMETAEEYECDGLSFNLYDMWDDKYYRDDNHWTAHAREWLICVRYNPDKTYEWNETPLHCGRFPMNASDRVGISRLGIQHWGWAKESDRIQKYERYKRCDPEGKWGSNSQYESIIEPHPRLVRFI